MHIPRWMTIPEFLILVSVIAFIFLVDLYVWQAIKVVIRRYSDKKQRLTQYLFWLVTTVAVLVLIFIVLIDYHFWPHLMRTYLFPFFFMIYLSKLFLVLFMLADDIRRGMQFLWEILPWSKNETKDEYPDKQGISRSEFLVRSGLIVSMLPLATMTYGMVRGGYNFTLTHKSIPLPNLPEPFHGMRIAQISDLHAGTYGFPGQIRNVVDMVMEKKPDIIFVTGDQINGLAEELDPFYPIFEPMKAPMGIFAILGNHDFGEYVRWQSDEAEKKNFSKILQAHKDFGWEVLRNENRILEKKGEKIALAGVDNWSALKSFMRYGDLDKALIGTDEASVIILLTHDPSHFEKQVIHYPEVDVTFSGHTHGMQFGIDLPGFKWSPVKYVYKYWHGLYQVGHQWINVNRGLGFTGFPGRVGMTPEITIIDLVKNE